MTVKELKAYLDKFSDGENVKFTAADVKDRKAWPNCEISSKCLAGNRPMIFLELHERFWNPTEEGERDGMWIPVTEQLPKSNDYVLMSFENFTLPEIGRYEVNDEGDGAWYLGNDDEGDTCCSVGLFVNAWMPLPESYREE